MNVPTNDILCKHCEMPIESRRDLIVVLKWKDLVPLHHSCLADLRRGRIWRYQTLFPVSGSHGNHATKILKWTLFLASQIGIAFLVLSTLLTLDEPWWFVLGFSILAVPFAYFFGSLPIYWMTDWMVRRDMEPYKKRSWEEYESKLPEGLDGNS